MKELWVLTIQTSLPETCYNHDSLKKYFYAFESFEKAREALRQEVKKFAFSENAMFDGEGRLKQLEHYIENSYEGDNEDDEENGVLIKSVLQRMSNLLQMIFSDQDVKTDLTLGEYTDWSVAVELTENSIRFYGDDDGPINGYDPVLHTNMFSMQEEKDYYLYIDDCFGQDGKSAELYIDMKKVSLNQ